MIYIKIFRKIDKIARKTLGKSLRNHDFYDFEKKIFSKTKILVKQVYKDSLKELKIGNNIDPDFKILRNQTISKFKNSFIMPDSIILFYRPNMEKATGTYSAFKNIMEGMDHIGVRNNFFSNHKDLKNKASSFKKAFIFLEKNDLEEQYLNKPISDNTIPYVGIALHPSDNPSYEQEIIDLYNNKIISFCYTFSSREYIEATYKKILKKNIPIYDMEFGANPKIHYPVNNNNAKIIDFIFLGSTNRRKWDRYFKFFSEIFFNHTGFISGPGWTNFYIKKKPFNIDRILYSKCKVGLNLSVPSQLGKPRELNERTYQLAACGIVQLIDNPTLLYHRFPKDSLISVETPEDYYLMFQKIVNNEIDLKPMQMLAYKTVMTNYTIYHRATKLSKALYHDFIKESNEN